jgi:hypothetical protein
MVAFARFSNVGFSDPQQALVLPFLLNVTKTPERFRYVGGTAKESANSLSERLVNARPKCLLKVDFAIDTRDEQLELGASTSIVAGASSEVGEVDEVCFSATFAKFGCVEDKNEIDRKAATGMLRANFGFFAV